MAVVVQGDGPLTPFVAGYRLCLEQSGYSSRSVRERVQVVGRLNRWLVLEGLSVTELTPERAERFLEVWRAAGQQMVTCWSAARGWWSNQPNAADLWSLLTFLYLKGLTATASSSGVSAAGR